MDSFPNQSIGMNYTNYWAPFRYLRSFKICPRILEKDLPFREEFSSRFHYFYSSYLTSTPWWLNNLFLDKSRLREWAVKRPAGNPPIYSSRRNRQRPSNPFGMPT